MPSLRLPAQLALVLALALQASAQPAAYRIAGHIVSATDGHPLQRATVQIFNTGQNKPVASTTSGQDGSFAFASVPAGSFALEGRTPGFLAARYDEHDNFSTAIVTGAGVDTESLVLKLTPQAILSGRVTDEAAEPVRRAGITLYREMRTSGIARILRAGGTQTDDTGAYELPNLEPGRYFLSATATPWYVMRPPMARPSQNSVGIVESIAPGLDAAYPVTFYPAATDSSGASPIDLRAGDQAEISLRLTPQPALSVAIAGTAQPEPQPQNPHPDGDFRIVQQQYQAYRKVFDQEEPANAEMRYDPSAGVSITGLAPGQYILRQTSSQNGGQTSGQSSGQNSGQPSTPPRVVAVTLGTQNVQIQPGEGAELGSIKLLVHAASGDKLPPLSQVQLLRENGVRAAFQAVTDKGEVEFSGVEPGRYSFRVTIKNRQSSVTHLFANGQPLASPIVALTAGVNPTLTLVADTVFRGLSGYARQAARPAPGILILLVPASGPPHPSWIDQSDLDGSFHLAGIPPGLYNLLAIQDGWGLEWRRPGVLDRYLPLAAPVRIPADGSGVLQLPDAVAVQPR